MNGRDRASLLGEIVVLDDVGPIRRRRGHPLLRAVVAPLLVSAAVLVGVLVLLPVALTVKAALFEEGGFVRRAGEAGRVWDLDGFWGAWAGTAAWAALVPALVTLAGLVLAWYLPRSPGPVLRAVLVAPLAVPLVVTGVVFRLLYHPDRDRGVATYLFGWIPGEGGWLGPDAVRMALVLAFAWVWLGLVTVVIRSALDHLPNGVEDAARMSGRRGLALFRDAFWYPLVARVVGLLFVLMAVMSVRILDLVLVMTPPSMVGETRVFSVLHWQTSGGATTGASAALGTLWLAAAGIVLALALPLRPRWLKEPPEGRDTNDKGTDEKEAGSDRDGPDRRERRWVSVLPAAVAAAWLAPVAVLALTAFHGPGVAAAGGWWSRPLGLGSWADLGALRFWPSFWLTAWLALAVSSAAVVVGGLAVEALERTSVQAARVVMLVMVAAAVVPVQVIAGSANDVLGWVERASALGLPDAARLGLVHLSLAVPLCLVVLYATGSRPVASVRSELREAGGERSRAWKVAKGMWEREPPAVAAFVLVFLQVWNDFVVGLFFSGRQAVPLGLLLFGQTRQFVANSGPLAAGSLAMLAVPLALLVATHRKVIDGLTRESLRQPSRR